MSGKNKNKSQVASFFSNFDFRGAVVPVVFLVVGILFIAFPESSMNIVCYVLGSLMLVAGVVRLLFAFILPPISRLADVVFAFVIIAVGLLLIVAQSFVADFVTVVIGIVLIIDAVLKVEESLTKRKMNVPRWWAGIIVGIVSLVLGIAVLILSFTDSTRVLMIVAGVSMLFDSVSSLAILVYSAVRETKKQRGGEIPDRNDRDDHGGYDDRGSDDDGPEGPENPGGGPHRGTHVIDI